MVWVLDLLRLLLLLRERVADDFFCRLAYSHFATVGEQFVRLISVNGISGRNERADTVGRQAENAAFFGARNKSRTVLRIKGFDFFRLDVAYSYDLVENARRGQR